MEDKYLTVTQLTKYIKYKIDNDTHLMNVFLKGEISNFKAHTRGHMYFTIKDENSRINAVMFANSVKNLNFVPQDGMKVMVVGKISVYEATGGYQIYVNEMIEDGIGNLYIKYEQLKKKLEQEGLFDVRHKRPIVKIPKKIGVVTASTGAAVRDIMTTIKRRWPLVEVILFPSLVQGASAAPDIVRNIELANTYDLDTLIVGRGGGSIEDLWCFNDEEVARSIYNSKIPVISGVGHEIDFTIADFVADLRAPTPTAAAELSVPNRLDFYNHINQINIRLTKVIENKISFYKSKLDNIKSSQIFKNPINIYLVKEEKFDLIIERLKLSISNHVNSNREKLNFIKKSYILNNPDNLYKSKKELYLKNIDKLNINIRNIKNNYDNKYINLINKLEILNPLLTIKRGYSVVRKNDSVIKSIKDLKKDDLISIEISDGNIDAKVL